MSGGTRCRTHPRTSWRVAVLRGNYSAFNGYRFTPSAWSEVVCVECGARWRTTAAYVDTLGPLPADFYERGPQGL